MTEYKVKVYDTHTVWSNLEGKCHRENGPAIECADGYKEWYINDKPYTERSFNEYINKQSKPCLGKKIIVDGIEYELR